LGLGGLRRQKSSGQEDEAEEAGNHENGMKEVSGAIE
jgi:hypothetical protein